MAFPDDVIGVILAFVCHVDAVFDLRRVATGWRRMCDRCLRGRVQIRRGSRGASRLGIDAQRGFVRTLCAEWHIPPVRMLCALVDDVLRHGTDPAAIAGALEEVGGIGGDWESNALNGPGVGGVIYACIIRCPEAHARSLLQVLLADPFCFASRPCTLRSMFHDAVQHAQSIAVFDALAPYVTPELRNALFAHGGNIFPFAAFTPEVLRRLTLPPYSITRSDLSAEVAASILYCNSANLASIDALVSAPYCFGRAELAEPVCLSWVRKLLTGGTAAVERFMRPPFLLCHADLRPHLPALLDDACGDGPEDVLDVLAAPPFCCDHETATAKDGGAMRTAVIAERTAVLLRLARHPYNMGAHHLRTFRFGCMSLLAYAVRTAILQDDHALFDCVTKPPYECTRDDFDRVLCEARRCTDVCDMLIIEHTLPAWLP